MKEMKRVIFQGNFRCIGLGGQFVVDVRREIQRKANSISIAGGKNVSHTE
jgi:hypothetical protein